MTSSDCFLSQKVGFRKSVTENSQLNKKAAKHVGRYSGSFSPPGDGDVRAVYDMTTVSEMGNDDLQVKNSTPARGRLNNKPLDSRLLTKLEALRLDDFREKQASPTLHSRGKLFTPQPTRRGHENKKMFESPVLEGKSFNSPSMESKRIISPRVGINRYESPILGGKKTIINQLQKDQSFSSPKSERGFMRKYDINPQCPAR